MIITLTGKITCELPVRSGVSKTTGKEWVNQEFIIEDANGDEYHFSVFGEEKIKSSGLKRGVVVSVNCELKSREWNERWFTSLHCVECFVQNHSTSPAEPAPSATQAVAPTTNPTPAAPVRVDAAKTNGGGIDGLPF